MAYQRRGRLGQWCQAKMAPGDDGFLGAAWGTYRAVNMIAGLRAENQAHYWEHPQPARTQWSKQQVQERFAPASSAWHKAFIWS